MLLVKYSHTFQQLQKIHL